MNALMNYLGVLTGEIPVEEDKKEATLRILFEEFKDEASSSAN